MSFMLIAQRLSQDIVIHDQGDLLWRERMHLLHLSPPPTPHLIVSLVFLVYFCMLWHVAMQEDRESPLKGTNEVMSHNGSRTVCGGVVEEGGERRMRSRKRWWWERDELACTASIDRICSGGSSRDELSAAHRENQCRGERTWDWGGGGGGGGGPAMVAVCGVERGLRERRSSKRGRRRKKSRRRRDDP